MSETERVSTTLETELAERGAFAYRTSGVSMEPLFRTHRDVVVVKRPTRELRPLDVALYKSDVEGKYILHRVIGVRSTHYIMRGDNTFVREYVPKEAVVGVLAEFNRKGRSYSATHLGYRLYSFVWRLIYPLRWLFRHLLRVGAKLFRLFFKKKGG